jgi:serine/threonine-protein kinase
VVTCAGCAAEVTESAANYCPYCGNNLPPMPTGLDAGTRLTIECGEVCLGKVIGQGGMGIVRRGELRYAHSGANRRATAHPVAVKLLNPMLHGSDQAEQLFLGEAEALSRLAHPNIVHFFGLAQREGQLAIVMEFVQGRPLSDIIASGLKTRARATQPAIPMVPAWDIFSQLLGALASTHALGIIHRDVKPSNVLVRTDGVVKLTDYGIARLPMSANSATDNVAPGTSAYMSPEQVTAAPMDPRSDLYAAAIVLYEMLTGHTPFEAPERSELQLRLAQLNEVPLPLSSVMPDAPPVLNLFFSRTLAKDPQHRYPNAISMGEALRNSLGLPDTSGWAAERRLAERAVAISRLGTRSPDPTLSEVEASDLRTNVMAAYQG